MDTASFVLPVAIAMAAFGLAMLAMAVGAMFKRKCLRSSCGGPAVLDASGKEISCPDCPNRSKERPSAR
jgi:hypothetical protein